MKLRLAFSWSRMNQSAVDTAWPLSWVRLSVGAVPRIEIRSPSPNSREMVTPGTRCSDSATFLSGNLPISSAVITSRITSAVRLSWRDCCRDWRMPTTTTSELEADGAAAAARDGATRQSNAAPLTEPARTPFRNAMIVSPDDPLARPPLDGAGKSNLIPIRSAALVHFQTDRVLTLSCHHSFTIGKPKLTPITDHRFYWYANGPGLWQEHNAPVRRRQRI